MNISKAFWTISERSELYKLSPRYKSATELFHKGPIKSHQMYDIQPQTSVSSSKINAANIKFDPVGKPVKHKAADKQVSLLNMET